MIYVGAAITLFILQIILFCLWLRRNQSERHFLATLTSEVTKQAAQRQSLALSPVPYKFLGLYHSLDNLLLSLPANTGRDKLTGLANRVGLKRSIAAMMPMMKGSFVLIDIYRFRYVNDLFGFVFGDELLKCFAKRLQGLQHAPKLIARMNGDEFLLYFEEPSDKDSLTQLKGRLLVPFDIKGTPISVRLQIGYLNLEEHHADASLMLRRLDLALKNARHSRDAIAPYYKNDDISQQRELQIINSLPKALQQDNLYMVYQPKEDIATGGTSQVEALIRWEHEQLGIISPGEFIPLAEYAGMIELVTRWALEKVMQQQVKWRAEGLMIQVAVNLSTRDLDSESLPAEIEASLSRHHLPAECLVIEITESAIMADTSKAIATLHDLRRIGVKLAIDDFGTGHSSLAYLKHLPVDEVKIDKAFLADLKTDTTAQHIMETSILLAKKLGFEVTVEGIETVEIRDMLVEFGVDKLQGLLFAKPMTAPELEFSWKRLQQNRRAS